MIEVTRIQYPVGQGCFHVGTVKWDNEPGAGCFRYVYDCGSKNKTVLKRSVNCMLQQHTGIDALFVSHLHDDHVNGLDRLLASVRVNTVFIPHLSVGLAVADLIAAATDDAPSHALIEASLDPYGWFGQRGVYRIIRVQPPLPDEAPVGDVDPEDPPGALEPSYSEISLKLHETSEEDAVTPADLELMGSGEMLAPDPGPKALDWVFVPHVDPEPQTITKFEAEIAKVLGMPNRESLTAQQLAEALRDANLRKALKGCYTRCFGANHNRVSMSVYSGPKSDPRERRWKPSAGCWFCCHFPWEGAVGWIGTGDAELKNHRVRKAWQHSYRFFRRNLSTLLLPHHGSHRNFSSKLLNYPRLVNCIASAGDPSPYSHPSVEVIESVRRALKYFHHVSKNPNTLFFERYNG